MALYLFQHPKTKQVKEVYQKVNEEHFYVDDSGLKWDRIFTVPHAATDTNISSTSSSEFSDKMGRKRGGTVGDLLDASKEASEKRSKADGKDSIKQKYFSDWSKRRKGKRHPGSYED